MEVKIAYLARNPLYTTEKPYHFVYPIQDENPDATESNRISEDCAVTITDVRSGRPQDLGRLDTTGWMFTKHYTKLEQKDFWREDVITAVYYPEIESLMKSTFDRYDSILFLDHTVREITLGSGGA